MGAGAECENERATTDRLLLAPSALLANILHRSRLTGSWNGWIGIKTSSKKEPPQPPLSHVTRQHLSPPPQQLAFSRASGNSGSQSLSLGSCNCWGNQDGQRCILSRSSSPRRQDRPRRQSQPFLGAPLVTSRLAEHARHLHLQTGASGGIGAATVSFLLCPPRRTYRQQDHLQTAWSGLSSSVLRSSIDSETRTSPAGHCLCSRRRFPDPHRAPPSPTRRSEKGRPRSAQRRRDRQGRRHHLPHARHAGPSRHQGLARPHPRRAQERRRPRQQCAQFPSLWKWAQDHSHLETKNLTDS